MPRHRDGKPVDEPFAPASSQTATTGEFRRDGSVIADVAGPDRRPVMSTRHSHEASVVLVVENFMRMSAAVMLEDAGFPVVAARHADEAWFVLHERSDTGVLFPDLDRPGSISGVTLAGRVRRSWPDIRPVSTSGRHRLADFEVPDPELFVPKPYAAPQVVDAIHGAT